MQREAYPTSENRRRLPRRTSEELRPEGGIGLEGDPGQRIVLQREETGKAHAYGASEEIRMVGTQKT